MGIRDAASRPVPVKTLSELISASASEQRNPTVPPYWSRLVSVYVSTQILAPLVFHQKSVAPARVFGVATFYSHFALEPKGKHVIRVCDGTACHVKQSTAILDAVTKPLGLGGKRKTTPDMMFTVETVACLGACGLAPVVVADEQVHGQMTPESGARLVDEIRLKEGGR